MNLLKVKNKLLCKRLLMAEGDESWVMVVLGAEVGGNTTFFLRFLLTAP